MPTPADLRALRDVLAHLYPEKSSASRVAEDAGLSLTLLALNDRAIENWHAVVQEAKKQERLAQLLSVVDQDYGGNPTLRAVSQQLRNQLAAPKLFRQPLIPRQQLLWGLIVFAFVASIGVWSLNRLGQGQPLVTTPTASTTATTLTVTPHATPASFTYGVTVLDSSDQPIAHAQVSLEIQGRAPLEDEADSSGYTRIQVPASYVESAGRLRIYADGFTPFDQHIDIYPERLPNTVRLTRP